ncbi:hypothetical protein BVRB_8g185330 [Beta vulgaris subsp. vulgaris]|nr:hypothetical protein BVRB_8g185330 [Beta vulgaris subsp. vulgaris]
MQLQATVKTISLTTCIVGTQLPLKTLLFLCFNTAYTVSVFVAFGVQPCKSTTCTCFGNSIPVLNNTVSRLPIRVQNLA